MTEPETLEGERIEYETMGVDDTIRLQRLDKNRPQKDTSEMTKLRDTTQDLHKKIVALESKLQQVIHGAQRTIPSQSRTPQFRFADDGTPICWKCVRRESKAYLI